MRACVSVAIQTIQIPQAAIRQRYTEAPQCTGQRMTASEKPDLPPKIGSVEPASGQRAAAHGATARTRADDEERYALALESINHGVYDWDIVKNTVYDSPLLRAIFGMAEGQILTPEESGARIHPDDVVNYRKAITDHLKGITPHLLVEYRYLSNEQTWRWARQSGIAQRGPGGHAVRMVRGTSDITEHKQREEEPAAVRWEIEATREIMRTVLENMNDGIVLIDKDFNWKFGNDQFNRFLLIPPEITQPGIPVYEVLRYQAERGDFGETDDVEATVRERAVMMRTPDGFRYERRTKSGLHIEFT